MLRRTRHRLVIAVSFGIMFSATALIYWITNRPVDDAMPALPGMVQPQQNAATDNHPANNSGNGLATTVLPKNVQNSAIGSN